MVEQMPPTLEVRNSNPDIGKFNFLSLALKGNYNRNRGGNGLF